MQDERWQQVIVDRDGLLSVRSRDGQPFLEVGAYQVGLMGETRDLASPRGLTMSLDSLLAWGAGRETVRVYQVLLSFQAPQPHVYSPQPWRRRIVAQYELDVGAIARTVGQIRETVAAWEAEVADFRQVCRHEPRSDDENIVVT